jgi:hypothetical protein
VPRKRGVEARHPELTVRRERQKRRRRRRIGRRRGRETRGARAPSLPAGCLPQVWNSRIKGTVQQVVSPQFFLSWNYLFGRYFTFFDWGIVWAKSLFKNCKKRLSLLFYFQ